jgi:hypothetical protein
MVGTARAGPGTGMARWLQRGVDRLVDLRQILVAAVQVRIVAPVLVSSERSGWSSGWSASVSSSAVAKAW